MLHYLLIGYIVAYVIIAVGIFTLYPLIMPADEKKDDEPWETPLDIALSATGLAGMLFLLFDIRPHWLEIAWRPVSVALVLVQVWGNLKALFRCSRSLESTNGRDAVAFASIGTLLFLAPSLGLNVLYAFR